MVTGHDAMPMGKQHPQSAVVVAGDFAMLAEPAPSRKHVPGPLVSVERNGD